MALFQFLFVLVVVRATIRIGLEIQCLMYAIFKKKTLVLVSKQDDISQTVRILVKVFGNFFFSV